MAFCRNDKPCFRAAKIRKQSRKTKPPTAKNCKIALHFIFVEIEGSKKCII